MTILNTWQNPQDGSMTSGVELLWYEEKKNNNKKAIYPVTQKAFRAEHDQEQERSVQWVQAIMETILTLKTFDPENWWARGI